MQVLPLNNKTEIGIEYGLFQITFTPVLEIDATG